jgi:branched-subunit amino acid ABC-type transport system permease component
LDLVTVTVIVLLNGLVLGLIYALISLGFSLVFGLMGLANFAHGVFYTLGGYFAYTLMSQGFSFGLAIALAPIMVALIGLPIERFVFHPLYKATFFYQFVAAFGLMLALTEVIRIIWGLGPVAYADVPTYLTGTLRILGISYPTVRIFLLLSSLVIAVAVWLFLNKTPVGLYIRAGLTDKDMASALGVNISMIYTVTFGIGVGIAGLAGSLTGMIYTIFPESSFDVIIYCIAVVVIGGIGSFKGSIIAGVIVGLLSSAIVFVMPEAIEVVVFIAMALTLIIKKTGLFGRETYVM